MAINDPLSRLHDDLLVSIISLLPVRDMVRTSAVSRRWARLWTLAPRLDLRCRKRGHRMGLSARRRISEAIDTVVRSNAAHVISTFLISLHAVRRRDKGWIDSLSRKRIHNLTIDGCSHGPVALPGQIFSISSLQELAIDNCKVKSGADFSLLVNLRSLRLRNVEVSGRLLSAAVSALPRLERLFVCRQFAKMKKFKVRSETLRQLEIGMMYLETLKIDAPVLDSLAMDVVVGGGFVIRAPSLKVLNTNPIFSEEELFIAYGTSLQSKSSCQRSIELLELSTGIYKNDGISQLNFDYALFSRLHRLSVTLNLNDMRQIVVLAFVMTDCLALQHLDITVGKEVVLHSDHSCLPYSDSEYWRRQTVCSLGCISRQLDHIAIRDYTGETLELEFVRFLILKATALKRLVIWHQCSEKCYAALMYVMSLNLPVASADLSIALNPEVKEWKSENLLWDYHKKWLSLVDDEQLNEAATP